jgi:hypothetical protein
MASRRKKTKKAPSSRTGGSKKRARAKGVRTAARRESLRVAREDQLGREGDDWRAMESTAGDRDDDRRRLLREIASWGERSETARRRIKTERGWLEREEPIRGQRAPMGYEEVPRWRSRLPGPEGPEALPSGSRGFAGERRRYPGHGWREGDDSWRDSPEQDRRETIERDPDWRTGAKRR